MRVLILGASRKTHRYAYRAQEALMNHGYDVIPVSRRPQKIRGVQTFQSLAEIPTEQRPIHTVTVYVNEQNLRPMIDDLIALEPQRVIFNPGAENELATRRLTEHGIMTIDACTLVMLSVGSFEPSNDR